MKALIEIKGDKLQFMDYYYEQYTDIFEPIDTLGAIENDVIQAIVTITTTTIPIIASVIIAIVNKKKEVSVKYKGIEISGFSEKNAKEFIEELLEKESNE